LILFCRGTVGIRRVAMNLRVFTIAEALDPVTGFAPHAHNRTSCLGCANERNGAMLTPCREGCEEGRKG
jgi:hypothetical protein